MTVTASRLDGVRIADGRPWLLLWVLTGCAFVSVLDRFVIGLLIQPIATSLHLSDVQISLLIGIAFTLFYATVGIALGRLADLYDRRRLIVLGVIIWTLATAATGLAWSYGSLMAARIVVGVGEATLAPCAYSLIADAFPRDRLSRPTTIFFLGSALGPGLSLILGGLLLHWADQLAHAHQLGLFDNEPWRFVMLAAAAPGLIAAIAAVLFIHEGRPLRGSSGRPGASLTLWDELKAKPTLYLGLLGGTAVVSIYINGLVTWWPTYALRHFGWPLKESGIYFGAVLAIGSSSGIVASGYIGSVLVGRYGDAGNGLALVLLAGAGALVLIGTPFVTEPNAQLACVCLALAFAFAVNALAPVGCQLASGPEVRGRISALYVGSSTIIGGGLGPLSIASLENATLHGLTLGLGGAMAFVGLACSLGMIAFFTLYWRAQPMVRV